MISDLGTERVQQTTSLEQSMNQLFPLISQEQANGQWCEKKNLSYTSGEHFLQRATCFSECSFMLMLCFQLSCYMFHIFLMLYRMDAKERVRERERVSLHQLSSLGKLYNEQK